MIDLSKYPAKWLELSAINLENRIFQFRCNLEDAVLLASFIEKGREVAIDVRVRLSGKRVVVYGWKRVTAALAAKFEKMLVIEILEAEHGYEDMLDLRLDEKKNLLKGNYDEKDYIGIVASQAALGKSLRQIAKRIRKSHIMAANWLIVSKLPVEIVDGVKSGKISVKNVMKIVYFKPASEAGETDCKPGLQPGGALDASNNINAENTVKLVKILKLPYYKKLIKNLIVAIAGGAAAKRNDFLSAKQQGQGAAWPDLNICWKKPAGKDIKDKETELGRLEADIKSAEAMVISMEKSNADTGPLKRQETLKAYITAIKTKLPKKKTYLKAFGKNKPFPSPSMGEGGGEGERKHTGKTSSPSLESSPAMGEETTTKHIPDDPVKLEQLKKQSEALVRGDWKETFAGKPSALQIPQINGMIFAINQMLAKPGMNEEQRQAETQKLTSLQAYLDELSKAQHQAQSCAIGEIEEQKNKMLELVNSGRMSPEDMASVKSQYETDIPKTWQELANPAI